MKIEKVEIIRVSITETLYCEVITAADGVKDFWLKSSDLAKAVHMFGIECPDEKIVDLIFSNYEDYLDELFEE